MIAHLVRAREPPKKLKIRVTRKPDLETQNWVCSFSSFIRLYQTHIVTAQMLFDCWTVLLKAFLIQMFWNFSNFPWIATMASTENRDENLDESISGIFGEKSWVPIAMLWFLDFRKGIRKLRIWEALTWTHQQDSIHIGLNFRLKRFMHICEYTSQV